MAEAVVQTQRRIIAIIGMHRSGTSCLTGSLQGAGLELGEVHTWNRYNRRGNREKQAIVDLNDGVLADNGGSWDRPPESMSWNGDRLGEASNLLRSIGGEGIAGFKDPRTLLTLDGWLRVAPALEFVGVFRHPIAVARSLEHRSAMGRDEAFALWYLYNRKLLALHRRRRFPLVNFDVNEATYLDVVARISESLGLSSAAAKESPFFDESLRSAQGSGKGSLPYRLKLLHWQLCRRAIT